MMMTAKLISLYTPDSQTKISDGADTIMPHLKCEQRSSNIMLFNQRTQSKEDKK
jgi:hypothetical protein